MSADVLMSAQVVHSVIMTRPVLEDRARASLPLQDMVRGLPADLFRTCLARVRAHLGPSKTRALPLAHYGPTYVY